MRDGRAPRVVFGERRVERLRRSLFEDIHDDFRESVRGFLTREAVPHRQQWERAGIVDRDFWKCAAAQGYVGFSAPVELGGTGVRDFRFNAVLDEEIVSTGTVGDGFALSNDIVGAVSDRPLDARAATPLAARVHGGRDRCRYRDE